MFLMLSFHHALAERYTESRGAIECKLAMLYTSTFLQGDTTSGPTQTMPDASPPPHFRSLQQKHGASFTSCKMGPLLGWRWGASG
jgi:hypothetical protein